MKAMLAEAAVKSAVTDAPHAQQTRARKRIVIIGGGFAGIAAARALKHTDAEVVLIDRRNHHIFQPLLYQAATAVLAPSEIAAPIRQLAVKQRNLTVVLAEVTGVDLNSRTVDASWPGLGTRKIPFDFLVVATGMRPSYFGHDEFARYAPGLKNLNDAETIRTKIVSAFEFAEDIDDPGERSRQMTFVLVGAGPTGVELAGSMAHMVTVTLRGNFRRINPAESTIVLLEGGNRVLPSFAESLSKKATKRLKKLGVKVMTGVKVEKVDEQGVVAGGKRIPSATGTVDRGSSCITDRENVGRQDRSGRSRIRWSVPEPSGCAGRLRRRRYSIGHAGRTLGARRRPGSDPARALCGAADLRAA
jgi:NADH:ubiquinone reductase (H+-translocating)